MLRGCPGPGWVREHWEASPPPQMPDPAEERSGGGGHLTWLGCRSECAAESLGTPGFSRFRLHLSGTREPVCPYPDFNTRSLLPRACHRRQREGCASLFRSPPPLPARSDDSSPLPQLLEPGPGGRARDPPAQPQALSPQRSPEHQPCLQSTAAQFPTPRSRARDRELPVTPAPWDLTPV